MQRPAYGLLSACVLLCVFLLGAGVSTRSGFLPFAGSTAIWRLPPTDSVGCFRSDGAGAVTIVSCVAGSGTGDASTNTSASVVNEIALFADTSGKLFKRATGTGLAALTSGQLGTVTAPSGAVVGTSDTQVLTNKDHVKRSVPYTDAATVTINADTTDIALLLTLSQTTTFANPTTASTIPNGKVLLVRTKSSSPRSLIYGSEFRGSASFPLRSITSGSNLTDYDTFIRNSVDARWDYFPAPLGF